MAPSNARQAKQNSSAKERGDVLPGPKKPTWSCPCGRDGNWASRSRCACGRAALVSVANKARAAAKSAAAKTPSSTAAAPSGDPAVRKLQKQLEASRAANADLRSQLAKPPDADCGGGPATKEPDTGAFSAKIDKLERQIRDTVAMFDCEAEAAACVESMRAKLADLKGQREACRTPQSSHSRAQRLLGQACKRRDTLLQEQSERKQAVATAFRQLQETKAALAKQDAEVAALRESFRVAVEAVSGVPGPDPLDFDFGLDAFSLEGVPEQRWLVEKKGEVRRQVEQARAAQKQRLDQPIF